MREHDEAFHDRADRTLGAALRAALDPREPAAFVGRVLETLDRTRGWRVLAAWARAGIAAAAIAALLAGAVAERAWYEERAEDAFAPLSDATTSTAEAALLASEGDPDPTALLSPLLGP
jgi:hypothetical protein